MCFLSIFAFSGQALIPETNIVFLELNKMKITFILNDQVIQTEQSGAGTLLDFIRYEANLRGTKIGCREGDCGACTVLSGTLQQGKIFYQSLTSCLTPLANAHGKHIVTVEGFNLPGLNKVQEAMVECSGTQCGFCTPGFVVSLGGYALQDMHPSQESAISAIDGNICRCTGYKSIERAACIVQDSLEQQDSARPLDWLVEHHFIPAWFRDIPQRLEALNIPETAFPKTSGRLFVGGGTDLYVQKPDALPDLPINYIFGKLSKAPIESIGNTIHIQGGATATDLMNAPVFLEAFPRWYEYFKLVSSTPIRNIGTVAGNLVNASPIGDITAMLLALNARILLQQENGEERILPLRQFYKAYKTLDKAAGEWIAEVHVDLQKDTNTLFHFEKVCKRTYLDIASVNTAISLKTKGNLLLEAHVSAGGVAPVPLYLDKTSRYLEGKTIQTEMVLEAIEVLQSEIHPISDARGSAAYKRTLARQLFMGHFLTLFPETIQMEALV
jgi:xanthine dehydrogenase small subunit